MTHPNPGPATQSTGNVAGGPYAAWSGTNTTQLIGPAGLLVSLGGGVGGGVALYDGANSITSGTAQFSNANGVTFGFNGQTITASASASQSVQTQASGAIAGSGFTTATTAGTAVVGTNNSGGVSLGVPKYITGFTQTNQSGISSIADSANTQSIGMLSFANSNGVTFGLSTGALTATITASIAGGVATGISSIADAANTQTVGMLSFGNANGITFGLATGVNTGTITASVNFAGLISNINVSAGTTSSNVSAVTFSNAHGVSFGYDGTNVTGSIATTYAGTGTTFAGNNASGSMTLNTAGLNLSVSVSTWAGTGTTFAGTNVSGSYTLNTAGLNVALSAPNLAGATLSRWMYPYPLVATLAAMGNATMSFQYVPAPQNVTATRLDALVQMAVASTATAATVAVAMSQYAAIYTRNGASLSSLSSGSTQTTYSYASNSAGNTELIAVAIRPISVPMNINMTPGEYYVGFNLVTATSSIGAATTTANFSITMLGANVFATASNYAEMGAATATSVNVLSGMGLYSAASTGLPASVSLNNINATGGNLFKANIALVFRNV